MAIRPTRRALLAAGGLTAAAVTTGCTTYGANGKPVAAPRTPAGPALVTAPVTLGKTSDIPVGGGTVFADQLIVVTQPKPGEFKAFTATCTHLGCTVANVRESTINCDCHGSRFNITTGAVVDGPATLPLGPRNIAVQGGAITME